MPGILFATKLTELQHLSTITQKELILLVSDHTGCKKNLSPEMVDGRFAAMRDSLIEGHRMEIRGFGVFGGKDTRPKPAARNPRTGEIIHVPARGQTHIKPGRRLKQALHQEREYGEGDGECAARPAVAELQATGPAIQQVSPPGEDSN